MYFLYETERRIETSADVYVEINGPEGVPISEAEAARLIRQGYTTYSEALTRKANHGGAGRGQGRTTTKPKSAVSLTLDDENIHWVDAFGVGESRSDKINTILTTHRQRIEQMIKKADELNERF